MIFRKQSCLLQHWRKKCLAFRRFKIAPINISAASVLETNRSFEVFMPCTCRVSITCVKCGTYHNKLWYACIPLLMFVSNENNTTYFVRQYNIILCSEFSVYLKTVSYTRKISKAEQLMTWCLYKKKYTKKLKVLLCKNSLML